MSGGFVKKTIDLEALQRQAEQAALEEEAKKNANTKKPKEKKVREKKVKEKKVREEKKGKEKKGKEEKEKKAKKSSSSSSLNSGKSSSKSKKSKVKLGPRLFGLPLTTSEDGEPPEFFTDIITYLEGHATEMEGLFRKTASTAAVEDLVQRYEAGEDIDWSTVPDYHLIGGVLMAFLLRLPEPLITFVVYDKLMTTASIEDKNERLAKIKEHVKSLPSLNFEMLEILLDFLDTMTRDAEDNLMHSENLAICFGPALLRRQEDNLAQLMRESPIVTNVVTCLIEYFGYFFRDEEFGAEKKSAVKVDNNANSNLKDFVYLSIKNLEASLDIINGMVAKLDYTKMWSEETLGYISIAEIVCKSIFKEEINELNGASMLAKQEELSASVFSKIKRQPMENYCSSLKDSFVSFITETRDTCNILKSQESFVASDSAKFIRKTKFIKIVEEYLTENVNFVSGTEDDYSTVKKLVPLIKNQLTQIKQDLAVCKIYSDAVIISRAVRASQKVLKEKNKAPLDEALSKPAGGPTVGTQKQIESLQDALEFSFPASEKILNELLKATNSPDLVRDADILHALHIYLESYFKLKNAPESKPSPLAPHPSQAVKVPSPSPTPVALHPSQVNNNNKPPPVTAHPADLNRSPSPSPLAPHPSQANNNNKPAPFVPHPSQSAKVSSPQIGANKPPPLAAHPSEVNKPPPPLAPHPSQSPAPLAPHPSQSAKSPSPQMGANKPPPLAAHPSEVNKPPPPLAPHPSQSPAPLAPHPSQSPLPLAPHPSQFPPAPLAPHPSQITPIEIKPIPSFPGLSTPSYPAMTTPSFPSMNPSFPSMIPPVNANKYAPVPLFSGKSAVPFPGMFDDDDE